MEELITQLSNLKEDIVFVGGVSLVQQGIKESANDIDIVVLNLDGLETLGEIETYTSTSEMSKSKNRGWMTVNGILIDIFIEDELPTNYIEVNGVKYETVESIIAFYQDLLLRIDGRFKEIIQSELSDIINSVNKTTGL